MSKHHRFTGRELSTLLEQVRDELGSEATILEANKIRTGGVAGFFKTEQYEVVAAPGGSSIELDDEGGTRAVHLDLIEPDGSASAGIVIGEPPHAVDRIDLSTAIDEVRAERFRDVPDTLDIRTPLPSSLPPQDRPRPDDFSTDRQEPALPALSPGTAATARQPAEPIPSYFDTIASQQGQQSATALLDRALIDQTSIDETNQTAPTGQTRFGDILSAELRQPEISIHSNETEAFWAQLEEADTVLRPVDVRSPITTIVGNRTAALTVAHRLMASEHEVRPALAAISPFPDELPIPAWQIIETMTELDDRLRFWSQSDRSGVIIVDADLGEDAITTVDRVRAAGTTALRLTIDDDLPAERIVALIRRLGGTVLVDLTFRAAPAYVLSLIDSGVTVASVDGHEVNAGLVCSLRLAVHDG